MTNVVLLQQANAAFYASASLSAYMMGRTLYSFTYRRQELRAAKAAAATVSLELPRGKGSMEMVRVESLLSRAAAAFGYTSTGVTSDGSTHSLQRGEASQISTNSKSRSRGGPQRARFRSAPLLRGW